MGCLRQVQGQLECMYSSVASQANSCFVATKQTIEGVYDGTIFHTNEAAKYIFGQNRTDLQRRLFLSNFVLPVVVLLGATVLLFNAKVTASVAAITALFTLIVAKQKGTI